MQDLFSRDTRVLSSCPVRREIPFPPPFWEMVSGARAIFPNEKWRGYVGEKSHQVCLPLKLISPRYSLFPLLPHLLKIQNISGKARKEGGI